MAPAATLQDRRPIILSGPSGAGKSTLTQRLLHAYPDTFSTTVSHTTRKPRAGEQDGTAYFFVSRPAFQRLIATNALVEHTQYNGELYGTSRQTVADAQAGGRVVLLDVDVEGVRQMRRGLLQRVSTGRTSSSSLSLSELRSESGSESGSGSSVMGARYVFVKPPSFEVLEARLRSRKTESDASVSARLERAREELECVAATPGLYDCVVVNGGLEEAYGELCGFIFGGSMGLDAK